MRTAAIVPAAGSSERFGTHKLRADISGRPLIERTIASLRDAGVDDIVVVTGPGTDGLVNGRDVRIVTNRQPERGMFSSLQAGMEELVADVVLVLPGDMPFVRPATIRSLLQVFEARGGIVSPRYQGKRGHPVLLPERLTAEVLAAEPTSTLHQVISQHRDERVDLDVDDPGVLRDVDRPEDLVHA